MPKYNDFCLRSTAEKRGIPTIGLDGIHVIVGVLVYIDFLDIIENKFVKSMCVQLRVAQL